MGELTGHSLRAVHVIVVLNHLVSLNNGGRKNRGASAAHKAVDMGDMKDRHMRSC